jgi:hypothetical protein
MTGFIRLCARIVATPMFIVCFGICWLGFVFLIGTAFQIFSFLENDDFNWKAHIADCNDFFCEPLRNMWKSVAR